MPNTEYKGSYDPELNIVFATLVNKPKTSEDIDVFVNGMKEWLAKGGENKVWVITDISHIGMAPVGLVKYYHKEVQPLADKYIIDFSTVCSKPLEKIAANLFNVLMREKHPIFKTFEEAKNWTLKEQETKGRFVPR